MSGIARSLATTLLLLPLLASFPARSRAQDAGGGTLGADRLHPERRTFRLTVLREGLPTNAGERVVTLRETEHGGIPAWSIVERRLVVAGESVDSTVVSRLDFAPLHWEGRAGGARLVAAIAGDTLYGAVEAGSSRRNVVVGGVGRAVLSAGMLELLVTLLPLRAGFDSTLSLLLVGGEGGTVVPMRLTVDREEMLSLATGQFACWVVMLRSERVTKALWVSREGRGVVRSEEPMPDLRRAILEQVLVGTGPPSP